MLNMAFILGRYSVEFSGSVWAWITVVGSVVLLVLLLFRFITKPDQ